MNSAHNERQLLTVEGREKLLSVEVKGRKLRFAEEGQ